MKGVFPGVMDDRYVKCYKNMKILYNDFNNLYGWAMSQLLTHTDFFKQKYVSLREVPESDFPAETGYLSVVDLLYPQPVLDKTNTVLFGPYNSKVWFIFLLTIFFPCDQLYINLIQN